MAIFSTFQSEPVDDGNNGWSTVEPTSVPQPEPEVSDQCVSADNYSECSKYVNGMSCDGR